MAAKERQMNERSLENLKLGAQARYQGKIRQNFSILPETLEWLKKGGNASAKIDNLVAGVIEAAGRADRMIDQLTAGVIEAAGRADRMIDPVSAKAINRFGNFSAEDSLAKDNSQHLGSPATTQSLEANSNLTHDRNNKDKPYSNNTHEQIDQIKAEVKQLQSQIAAIKDENTHLRSQLEQFGSQQGELPDLEATRDRILKRWKIQRRAESKERIQEALSKFIAELRSPT